MDETLEKDLIYQREKLLDTIDTTQLEIFHEKFPRDAKKLYNELKKSQKRVNQILNKDQLELVFPRNNGNKTFSNKFDTTLTCNLIRNLCGYDLPSTGWDGEPKHRDTSKMADSIRLRKIRNKIHHHRCINVITKELYIEWYKMAQPPLKRLGCPYHKLNELELSSISSGFGDGRNNVQSTLVDMPSVDENMNQSTENERWCTIS